MIDDYRIGYVRYGMEVMTMEDAYKEVYFGEYCKNCKHWEKKENEEPCDECLENPVNLYSHKPVNYEEKE